MHFAPVSRILAGFAVFFSLAQLLPLGWALLEEQGPSPEVIPVAGFGASMAIGVCTALILWLGGRTGDRQFFRREGIAVVGLSWLLAAVRGSRYGYVWATFCE